MSLPSTGHSVSTKSALAFTLWGAIAALLVAAGPVAEPTGSLFQTQAAARRCAWKIDPYNTPGELYGVTPISRRNVWAVGTRAKLFKPLALHWLGAGWRSVPVPAGGPDSFYAADFTTSNDGWAVGAGNPRRVIAHWNGRRWSFVAGPDLEGRRVALNDVAALSKNDAWAVGLSSPAQTGPGEALIEHWDGQRWEMVPTPDVGRSQLVAVAGISGNNVWAVGNQVNNTLIEHWDGEEWAVVPNPEAPLGRFSDIAALSERDIWAVGSQGGPWPARLRPLIQHWDGTEWLLVSSPFPRRFDSVTSIAAPSSRDIWVSLEVPLTSQGRGAVARRIDAKWRLIKMPRRVGLRLFIAGAGRNDIWAAAWHSDGSVIDHYTCRP